MELLVVVPIPHNDRVRATKRPRMQLSDCWIVVVQPADCLCTSNVYLYSLSVDTMMLHCCSSSCARVPTACANSDVG